MSDFQPGQPDGHTGSNCVLLWNDAHGKWADGSCTDRLFFVCELENVTE